MNEYIVPDMPARGLPSLVYKRDGRLVAFEADKISQSLFAATQDLGQPSPFLARELADGVLHFLAAEVDVDQPTTAQIADIVAKVVRELGQPALAQVCADRQRRNHQEPPANILREKSARLGVAVHFSIKDAPDAVVRQCLRAYSLHAVFARDLAAAHEEGLLTLTGLKSPDELARRVLDPNDGEQSWLALNSASTRTIIFDSPEHSLTEATAKAWLRGLGEFCELTGREALLNIHVSAPPAWANQGVSGPLFEPVAVLPAVAQCSRVADILLEEIVHLAKPCLHIDWHLSDVDFNGTNEQRLENIAHHALTGRRVSFALDRPRRPVALGPGVDRRHSAVLLDVALELPRLLAMTGVNHDARLFLEKLPSLARMAMRAGVQKRNYLRARAAHQPGLARGFLLERARLLVMPAGLDQVVTSLLGQGMAGSKLSLDLGRQIVEVLHQTLQTESQAINLEVALDVRSPEGAGPTDTKQLHSAGVLHAITGFGTVPCGGLTPPEMVVLLGLAWRKTDLMRLGL